MTYPATARVQTPEHLANWRPLVQWIMAIPHLVLSGLLGYLSGPVAVVSWFAIMFTGKLPEGLANFQIMIQRYTLRAHSYAGFLHDSYPPFEFSTTPADPGDTPTQLSIQPALTERDRLTVGLRIFWVIPAMFFGALIGIVGAVMWLVGFFAVLFTGRWPQGLITWVMKAIRVSVRLNAYALLLTDEYPPFSTD